MQPVKQTECKKSSKGAIMYKYRHADLKGTLSGMHYQTHCEQQITMIALQRSQDSPFLESIHISY